MSKTNAEIFIDKYKELEQIIRAEYNFESSESLDYAFENDFRLRKNKKDLLLLREIRNLLQHQEKIKKKYIVEPLQEVIELEEKLIQNFKNKPKCIDYCIKLNDVCYKTINDKVADTIKEMKEKHYTHIPILENGKVEYVFDENSVFNYLADEEIGIDETFKFKDIKNYISLDNNTNEEYKFISKDYTVEKLKEDIEDFKKKGKRLDIAFITEKGKKEEKLLGLVTIWDIVNLDT
jgi:CBS domain-containing protein